ncbi:MAG: type IV secretory system conjugative DNA transfer family protein [Candidatus Limnocylindria bacterium]
MVTAILAVAPATAMLLHSGRTEGLSPTNVARAWWTIAAENRWGDPASAFPAKPRRLMPGSRGWWASFGYSAAVAGLVLTGVGRRVDRVLAAPTLGRRPIALRGARPRSWARPRDVSALVVRRRVPERFMLGTIGRPARLLAADEELNLLLVAPTRAGKTSRFVVPWTLESPGPCISLSVKTDVYRLTARHRAQLGRVWLWDPFGRQSAGWSPLLGCRQWDVALRRASHLADAGGKGRNSEAAAFWNAEGAKLLAPLLHAAAQSGRDMATVLRWLDEHAEEEPLTILDAADADAAAAQLEAVLGLDPRNSGTTYISAASLIDAYRHPQVQRTESVKDLSAERFLDGRPNTLYIVAGAEDQQLVAPIVVALISQILTLAATRANASGKPLEPRLRVVGDELPNIAPLRSLPRYVATMLDAGVRIASVCQDLAQLEGVFGQDKDTILSNSQVKLFLGPVSCPRTRRYIVELLGDEPTVTRSRTRGERGTTNESVTWRPRASAQLLQQLDERRALLVHGNLPAAVIESRPWWQIPAIRRSCDHPRSSELSLGGVGSRPSNGRAVV